MAVRLIVARVDIDRWEEQEQTMVKGSSIDICRVCEESVWLSPEGYAMLYAGDSQVDLICTDCHIRLEVERKRQGNDEPVEVRAVEGAEKHGITPRDVEGLTRLFKAAIKKEAEGG